jgi:cytochrome c oxidase cbb3-type subunit III
MHGIEERKEK